jgi:LacI family transcriptional regulator
LQKYPTLVDVAREAGCSANTVSRYINGKKYISRELSANIQKAINKLNYHPSIGARITKRQDSRTVALIVSTIKNDFYIGVIRGVEEFFREKGYNILLFDCNWKLDREKDFIKLSLSYRVDGIIITTMMGPKDKQITSEIIGDFDIPLVSLNYLSKRNDWYHVVYEDEKGAYLLTEHLIKVHNKKRIGLIYPEGDNVESIDRFNGYKKALKKNNISFNSNIVFGIGLNQEVGSSLIRKMLENEVDAIFTTNTIFGTGAIKALNEMKVKYPEDIAFVTFDTYDINNVFHPFITSLKRVDKKFGETAANIIFKRINNEKLENIKRIKASLAIRESCGCNLK